MQNVRIDTQGELRCWACGSKNFREKRTAKSKVMLGVGALATKKKLKCLACNAYNTSGRSPKPYTGPQRKRLGKKLGTFTHMHGVEDDTADTTPAPPSPPGPPQGASPAGWHPDPHGRHEQRYWDGVRWTEHVADADAQSVDPEGI